jgi:branched-chain amino acid transport system permease protein
VCSDTTLRRREIRRGGVPISTESLLLQTLNGLSFGALLFLLASGFTLVFGLMRIVNLAHGAFFLLGGYAGIVTMGSTGNLIAAIAVGMAVAAAVGLVTERFLLRRIRGQELPEVLVTVGVALVVTDLCLAAFGGNPRSIQPPAPVSGAFDLGPVTYPAYRLFLIGLAVLVGVGLYLVQHHSRLGALIRAGVDDRETASAMGIDIDRLFAIMFVVGAGLAGLAGVAAAGALTIRPGADTDILLFALVVVIVGGLGSVPGAAIGSILIGVLDAFAKVWIPELSYFAVFLPMAIVLVLRPRGLLGRPT